MWVLRDKAIDAIASAGDVTVSAYGNLLQGSAVWSVVLIIALFALTVLNWRVSYRFFTQKQVVMPASKFVQWLKL